MVVATASFLGWLFVSSFASAGISESFANGGGAFALDEGETEGATPSPSPFSFSFFGLPTTPGKKVGVPLFGVVFCFRSTAGSQDQEEGLSMPPANRDGEGGAAALPSPEGWGSPFPSSPAWAVTPPAEEGDAGKR